jgi:rhodanese-related sulfurtransferase
MCKGGGALKFDRASRAERWSVASNEELRAAIKAPDLVWLDVRTEAEIAKKPLPRSLRAERCPCTMFSTAALAEKAPQLFPNKAASILVLCSGGGRAEEARKCLVNLGYTGCITNGGMIEDLQEGIPDVLEVAWQKDAATGPVV